MSAKEKTDYKDFVAVTLPSELSKDFKKICKELGDTHATVIRGLIRKYVKEYKAEENVKH